MLLPPSCLPLLSLKMRMKKRTAGKVKEVMAEFSLLRSTYRIDSIPYNFVVIVFAVLG